MTAQILIGIDDTDNLETHGTGRRARQLGELLSADGLAEVDGITRHELLLDPRIPYTSHNSSANIISGHLTLLSFVKMKVQSCWILHTTNKTVS